MAAELSRPRHRIRRQVLELAIPDQAAAWELQSQLSRINRQRLLPVIDRCLTEASGPDRIDRIDSLEVDLGEVDLGNLERELATRLGPALQQALAEHVPGDEQKAADSRLELLVFFSRTGSLPWWADSSPPRLADECLRELIGEAPGPLVAVLRTLARDRRPLGRLVRHCSDDSLSALCAVLVPGSRREPEVLLRAHRAVPGVTPVRFRTAVWQAVLRVACGEASREAVGFWRQVLAEVALALGVTYVALVRELRRILESDAGAEASSLALLLERLDQDTEGWQGQTAPAVGRETSRSVRMPQAPDVEQFALACPGEQQEEDEGSGKQGQASPVAAIPGRAASAASRSTASSLALATPEGEEPLDLAWSDGDAAYVGNSGLVLLWPFLGSFFERLNLVTAKGFNDQAARQRAVGLLQYLVTENPSPPEYQVTLSKLLCGIELDEVFDFGPPVTEAEAEECTNLLRAVIGQAPILNDMSTAGFRGTFLLRRGVVSVSDGAWLLRVERETWDVVLDRFPWSWNWIKMSWMEAALCVEW